MNPANVIRQPDNRTDRQQWHDRAKCRTMKPVEFDTVPADTRDNSRALALCAGCPVIAECAIDALVPVAWGTIRAATPLPDKGARAIVKKDAVSRLALVARGWFDPYAG